VPPGASTPWRPAWSPDGERIACISNQRGVSELRLLRQDARYFIQSIDGITRQAEAGTGWRSDGERKHVLGQFAGANRIFEPRAGEAQ